MTALSGLMMERMGDNDGRRVDGEALELELELEMEMEKKEGR